MRRMWFVAGLQSRLVHGKFASINRLTFRQLPILKSVTVPHGHLVKDVHLRGKVRANILSGLQRRSCHPNGRKLSSRHIHAIHSSSAIAGEPERADLVERPTATTALFRISRNGFYSSTFKRKSGSSSPALALPAGEGVSLYRMGNEERC